MNTSKLQDLYSYNWWANERVLAVIADLRSEDLSRDLGVSFQSIQGTLVHIMEAELIWLKRWKKELFNAWLEPDRFPNAQRFIEKWQTIRAEQVDFFRQLTDEALNQPISYTNSRGERYSYPLWQMMMHVINHSTYHRGQITSMFKQLDLKPVSTDFLEYWDCKASHSI